MDKAATSYQNKMNRLNGEAFEARISAACDYYSRNGLAEIEKTPEPMKVLKSLGNGTFAATFVKKAQPDYKGVVADGKFLIFEAKFTTTDRMLQSRVTKEQTEKIEASYKLGAVCFVLCGFSSGNVYRIPWRIWRQMSEVFGRKYVKEEDIQGYRLKSQGLIMLFLGDIEKSTEKEKSK